MLRFPALFLAPPSNGLAHSDPMHELLRWSLGSNRQARRGRAGNLPGPVSQRDYRKRSASGSYWRPTLLHGHPPAGHPRLTGEHHRQHTSAHRWGPIDDTP